MSAHVRRSVGGLILAAVLVICTLAIPNTTRAQVPGTFAAVGNMTARRDEHRATLLPSGKVLVTGGFPQVPNYSVVNSSADLYDSNTHTFLGSSNFMSIQNGARLDFA